MNSRLVLQDANQMIDITLMEKELQKLLQKNKNKQKGKFKKERTDAQF
jgi:hypothetical protein